MLDGVDQLGDLGIRWLECRFLQLLGHIVFVCWAAVIVRDLPRRVALRVSRTSIRCIAGERRMILKRYASAIDKRQYYV